LDEKRELLAFKESHTELEFEMEVDSRRDAVQIKNTNAQVTLNDRRIYVRK
jgi:hypothetical protein